MRTRYVFFIAILAVLFLSACSTTAEGTTETTKIDTSSFSGNVIEVNIQAYKYGFEPSTIVVTQGDLVRITAESIDVPHGLAISGYNVDMYLNGLESETVEFVADKAGTFNFYCSVPCGSGHSAMQGVLIVEEVNE